MPLSDHSPGIRRLKTPRRGATARASEVLGTPVTVAVPLQRQPPVLVLGCSLVECASFALLVVTGSLGALAAVGTVGVVLLALAATNQRRVLAVTRMGTVVLSATLRGTATAAIGPAPEPLELPPARGVGAAVELRDGRWWVDRASYARLRAAREALQRGHDATDAGPKGREGRPSPGAAGGPGATGGG
jgi:hypothetical protein